MDKRKERGSPERDEQGKMKPITQDCVKGASSQETAQALGVSARKVEQARTVMDHGDQETKQAIEKGGMSFEERQYHREKGNHRTHRPVLEDHIKMDPRARVPCCQD